MKYKNITTFLAALLLSVGVIASIGVIARGGVQTATMSDIPTESVLSSDRSPEGGMGMQDTVFYSEHIKAVTAVTEVFGDGQRLTAAIVEYDTSIKNSSLSTTAFTVSGRNITWVYANNRYGAIAHPCNKLVYPIFSPNLKLRDSYELE